MPDETFEKSPVIKELESALFANPDDCVVKIIHYSPSSNRITSHNLSTIICLDDIAREMPSDESGLPYGYQEKINSLRRKIEDKYFCNINTHICYESDLKEKGIEI